MGYSPTQFQLEQMAAEEALKRKQWTPEKFLLSVEKYCNDYGHNVVDGIVEFCQKHEIDFEVVSNHLMSDRLYSLIQDDAEGRGLIKRTKKLGFE